jgi:CRISPR-associated protein Csm2
MGDWKTDLRKYLAGTGGGAVKKCKCGKTINNPKYDLCYDCNQKSRGTEAALQPPKLPDGYLEGGYFDEKKEKKYIKEAVFISWAKDVSAALRQQGMSPTAIRNFFNKLRAVEFKYKVGKDFDLARQDIFSFCRDVKYTENRGVTPALFTAFIEQNVELAKQDPLHFKAFVEHFQSVIAYYKSK